MCMVHYEQNYASRVSSQCIIVVCRDLVRRDTAVRVRVRVCIVHRVHSTIIFYLHAYPRQIEDAEHIADSSKKRTSSPLFALALCRVSRTPCIFFYFLAGGVLQLGERRTEWRSTGGIVPSCNPLVVEDRPVFPDGPPGILG
ncbi:hypothetical protein HD806DRAFT_518673 [Xylariaceae sp. AK1471]|nr:hypothetical protein HD806DRAFT_518673 [Xylariaceae sp. AK1471]